MQECDIYKKFTTVSIYKIEHENKTLATLNFNLFAD